MFSLTQRQPGLVLQQKVEKENTTTLSNQAAIVRQISEKLRVVKLLNKGS